MTIFSGMYTAFCCYESDFYTSFVLQMNFYKRQVWRYFECFSSLGFSLRELCFDY